MRSSIILLSLVGSSLAVPFGDSLNSLFGRHNNHKPTKNEHHGKPHHGKPHHGGKPPIFTGTGPIVFPYPTNTAPTIPTSTGGLHFLPFPEPVKPAVPLSIKYKLAPTNAPEKRQTFGTGAPPPFPTGTGIPFPIPTGGFPGGPPPGYPTGGPGSGFPIPSGGFPIPTGGFPGFPTTLETLTRGPVPTSFPDSPDSPDSPDLPDLPGQEIWQNWLDAWYEWWAERTSGQE
ncbi:hypothetical protein K504DRAFT_488407 [Pleomassaria siparia CBS 279.74]|uniref:Uncharacterized protein n=1 Tax=Pleomassaria siparia CBS 279.74 TaxID=1314801 RepID=A0A6G1KMS5_9PLEO|nr:hypothetical protein K504DRAFT_488407 [Pleomassaria siparia CBS 279.74]